MGEEEAPPLREENLLEERGLPPGGGGRRASSSKGRGSLGSRHDGQPVQGLAGTRWAWGRVAVVAAAVVHRRAAAAVRGPVAAGREWRGAGGG